MPLVLFPTFDLVRVIVAAAYIGGLAEWPLLDTIAVNISCILLHYETADNDTIVVVWPQWSR